MALFLGRRMALAAKVEAAEGTAETLAGSDGDILVYEPRFTPDIDQFDRKPVASDLSKYSSVTGLRKGKLTFKAELKGSGTAGTAPKIGKLLRACGMGETVVAVTSVTYAPISVAIPTLTLNLYDLPESGNTLRWQMLGASGTWRFAGKVGEIVLIEFEFMGVFVALTDQSALTLSGIETTSPERLTNISFTMQTFAAKISALAIDMGNEIVPRLDVNKTAGIFSYKIKDRRPTLSFDPEKELVATHDFMGKLLASTEGALSVVLGASAGNILTLTAPKAQYQRINDTERDGVGIFAVDCQLNRSSVNDEISLAWT
jgi:hypothetical protein